MPVDDLSLSEKYVTMILYRAFASFGSRCRVYKIFRSSVHRAAYSSVTTASEQHEVKDINSMPGPGLLQNMVMMIRYGGTKNLYDIQGKKFETFGPIFTEKMFGKQLVHIADIDAIAAIAQTEEAFPTRDFLNLDVIEDTAFGSFAGNDYERWKAVRTPVAPYFLRPVEARKFSPGINSIAEDAVKHLRRVMKDGRVIRLHRELSGFTTENILLMMYGKRMGFYDDPQNPTVIEFSEAVSDFTLALTDLGASVPLWRYVTTPTYKKLAQAIEKLYALAREFADIRSREQKNSSLCSINIFDILPHKSDERAALSANHLAVALSQIGIETTSTTLAWCLYHLARNPNVQDQAYEEIVSVMSTYTGDKFSEDPQFHSHLPYINGCVKETMRLNPILPMIVRTVEKDTTACGYTIPAGTRVCMWFWFLASLSKPFNKPEKFNPRRWIRGESQEKISPFASVPFGFGVRMCLGRRFAGQQMVIFLAHVLKNFRLEYVDEDPVKPKFHKGMVYPDRELPIRFVERV